MTQRVIICLSTRSVRFLDRSVPPFSGAPWSYTEHHIQHICRSDITSPPLTNKLYMTLTVLGTLFYVFSNEYCFYSCFIWFFWFYLDRYFNVFFTIRIPFNINIECIISPVFFFEYACFYMPRYP